MAKALRKYILCSSQRSGSTVYCRLLRMTGVLGAPAEYLVLGKLRSDRPDADADALRQAALERLREHATPNDITGVKLHFHQFDEFSRSVPLDTIGGFDLWVQVDRRDPIAQAVSLARAWQTRQYSSQQVAQGEASYSFDLIARATQRLQRDKDGWRIYFEKHGIRPLTVNYEDIVDDPEGAVGLVLAAFDVKGTAPVSLDGVKLTVQRNDESLEWAQRFQAELRARSPGAA